LLSRHLHLADETKSGIAFIGGFELLGPDRNAVQGIFNFSEAIFVLECGINIGGPINPFEDRGQSFHQLRVSEIPLRYGSESPVAAKTSSSFSVSRAFADKKNSCKIPLIAILSL
jgi:hypothetical protein